MKEPENYLHKRVRGFPIAYGIFVAFDNYYRAIIREVKAESACDQAECNNIWSPSKETDLEKKTAQDRLDNSRIRRRNAESQLRNVVQDTYILEQAADPEQWKLFEEWV